ncbi:MAG: tRNA pseudouridine(13) synthase TruD [Nanoarchaeota archaeon]
MYKIKQIPEDFYVKELIKLNLKKQGKYKCYLLKKKNYNTLDAIELISRINKIPFKNFGYAGNKDKNAATEQFISVLTNKNLENIKIDNIELTFLGCLDDRINLGNNLGNSFKIVIRNIDKKYDKINYIVNYFDEQRFSKNNVLVGKLFLQKKFKEICEILNLDTKSPINSLNNINKKLLKLYLNSFQSYLFNKALSNYLKTKYKKHFSLKYSLGELIFVDKFEKIKSPLISFDAKLDKNYSKILKDEGIKLEDFIIRAFPGLIEETSFRDVFVKVKNFKTLSYSKDELNDGKFKQEVSFSLPKGCYATILIKQMFR